MSLFNSEINKVSLCNSELNKRTEEIKVVQFGIEHDRKDGNESVQFGIEQTVSSQKL